MKFPAYCSATALGLLTPFLPCGPLYLIFGAALLADSAAKGAEFTLSFGLGTALMLAWRLHGTIPSELYGQARGGPGLGTTAVVLSLTGDAP